MTSQENIDPITGFITATTGEQRGDYSDWSSIGPWLHVADGAKVSVTIAFGVQAGTFAAASKYPSDYEAAVDRTAGAVTQGGRLLAKYASLENALAAQLAFEGAYEVRIWPYLTDSYGRETGIKAPLGLGGYTEQGCPSRDPDPRIVSDRFYTWFDFDCDYCTGAYSKSRGGLFHHTWLAEAPPPSPNTNMAVDYNYSDNPGRRFVPSGDRQVTVAWANLSETTPDPKSSQFDFRGYKIWMVSNWQRPVGAGGPFEDDWTLLADYRLFDAKPTNALMYPCPAESVTAGVCSSTADTLWPAVYVPSDGTYKRIRMRAGDLWNMQTGDVLSPDGTVLCQGWPNCKYDEGFALGQATGDRIRHVRYPVGRYHLVDRNVKNGFVYFYSVTAYDSTGSGQQIAMLNSRRSAVEAEGVVPQAGVDTVSSGAHVWVVPNPYRGVKTINNRPSSWDLTPNASDPTGTHIDFMGLPRGNWQIKIFTVSGDLVAELNARDAVNESIRSQVTGSDGTTRSGVNRQADSVNDGEARWNLISRNGQDVVSGIYLFTVELGGSVKHRGKFVIIR